MTSKETKKMVQQTLNPIEQGLKIRNIREIKNGGVMIEAGDQETLTTFQGQTPIRDI